MTVLLGYEERHLDYRSYREIDGYELKVFDSITELFSAIQEKNESDNLCRIVAGPGWNKDATIVIDGGEYHWADKKTMKKTIGRIKSNIT